MKPRILVLSKRQYMAKDLLDDTYGRFYEIPRELARLGHEVTGVALSYRKRSQGMHDMATYGCGTLSWTSQNLGPLVVPGLRRYFHHLEEVIESRAPDLIWACSDSVHAIIAHRLQQRYGIPYVVDLYDNFESFRLTGIPGILPRFIQACRKASGISCVSRPLIALVRDKYKIEKPLLLLENAINSELFKPLNKAECRAQLGLPIAERLIGTAGALTQNRGIDDLFQAFQLVSQQQQDLSLAIAGQRKGKKSFTQNHKILDFGLLPLDKVPLLFNALDVAIICNKDSKFGRYCFPQKFYEIIACGTPLVVARTESMEQVLAQHPEYFYKPGDPADLADKITGQLKAPSALHLLAPTWKDQALKLSNYIAACL